jgi:hypothetical protein
MGNITTLQIDEFKNKFRTLYLEYTPINKINEILEFNQNTFDTYYYLNKYGLRDYINDIKKERYLKAVERVSNEILSMDTENNAKMLAIKQKESEFIRETLLKDFGYSKRVETIGLNINKTETLDEYQKAKLDKLLKVRQDNSLDKSMTSETGQDLDKNNPLYSDTKENTCQEILD